MSKHASLLCELRLPAVSASQRIHILNCKVNSTNGGTFCKSVASLFLVFFFGAGGLSYVQIGPGIQNFTKMLPAYMRTRVSHGPIYAQRRQETKVILLKNFLSAFFPTSWSKIWRFSEFSTHPHILYMCAKLSKGLASHVQATARGKGK